MNKGWWWCESKLRRRRKWGDSFYLLSPSISSSEIGKKGNNFSFLYLLFHLDTQWIEWCLPTTMCGFSPQGRPSISLCHPFKCSSHPETPSYIQPEIIFNLDAPWPVKVACKISRHSGQGHVMDCCITLCTPRSLRYPPQRSPLREGQC